MASYGIEADRGNEAALDRIEQQLAQILEMLPQNRNEVLLPAMALRATWSGDFRRAFELLSDAGDDQSDERRAEHFSEVALYACAAGLRDEAQTANVEALAALERWDRPTRRALRARLVLALFELTRGRAGSAHRHLTVVKRGLTPAMSRLHALAYCCSIVYRTAVGQPDRALLAASVERLRAEQFGGIARLLEALPLPQTATGGYANAQYDRTRKFAVARGRR